VELRRLAEVVTQGTEGRNVRFVVDLDECITMDSTFMGVLASIGLNELKSLGEKLVIVNVNSQNMRLLKTLGLTQFMDVRQNHGDEIHVSDEDFHCLIKEDVSRTDRIVHMIEAHQDLCEADPSNNMRFESVLKYLQDSLKRESD
jgi:anti-anti-sigma factor